MEDFAAMMQGTLRVMQTRGSIWGFEFSFFEVFCFCAIVGALACLVYYILFDK